MNFLPEYYEEPKSPSNYFKLEDGENKIRILSLPVIGWEKWDGNTPKRLPYKSVSTKEKDEQLILFWAVIIWDYKTESIKIWQIKQASIRKALTHLSYDSDWGNPCQYDIKINKQGKDKTTRYTVNPLPHKPLADYLKEQFSAKPCNLEKLFKNEDPFTIYPGEKTTVGAWEESTGIQVEGSLTKEQFQELSNLIKLDENPQDTEKFILKACGVKELKDIKPERYDAAIKWVNERIDSQQKEAVPF